MRQVRATPPVQWLFDGPELRGLRRFGDQCFKDVLVVKGKENPSSKFDVLEVVEVTPRAQVEYKASMLGGNLGPYNNGS